MMRTRLRYAVIALALIAFGTLNAQKKTNVLFIAVDDLKPLIGTYGHDEVQTPNIDALAKEGVVFTNAHCQQAVCGPSRASIFTGMRPDYTGVRDLKTRMRDVNPDILAMPQYFKENGYATVAVGKIYDPRCVDKEYDGPSWSIPYRESSKYTYPEAYGEPGLSYYALKENQAKVEEFQKEAAEKGIKNVHKYVSERFKPSTECADVPDEAYMDGQIANNAIRYMNQLANEGEPFFLAVGFKRPHLPFAAPKKYWDLYKREDIKVAAYRYAVKNGVDIAYHKSGELYSYTDIPPLTSFSDIFTDNLPDEKQKELIHAYYASVSFIDAQVGKLMANLKSKGLDKNTIIVLWGDHGWHLGDHSLWCKHTNFEQATRVPLIIKKPRGASGANHYPVESLDVFPTLCEATGLNVPSQLQGNSLLPVFTKADKQVNDYAISQFGRGQTQGYSIRTERYRLTLWMKNNWHTDQPFNKKLIEAGELYDYEKDPLETENYYKHSDYKKIRADLMQQFEAFVSKQNKEINSLRSESKPDAEANDLSFGAELTNNWKTVARKGADAHFHLNGDKLVVDVKKLGEKPWDLALIYNSTIELKEGQRIVLTFKYQGPEMKIGMGPVNNKRVTKVVKPSQKIKVQTIELEATASGAWPLKMQLMGTGRYELGEITCSIQ
ncbi:sulfatase [Carboxylicivirga mesophila]|uniref:Sulfatase n=1 Tax=Carboxylicivirga mesophila TaxID=1166478 RepID=A0ABS5KG34_9BACT|nr:sulfatase [Carboxylicivirga mesophila]MBS2213859.1 sulfatase [Carboxylicivirga mesophila]